MKKLYLFLLIALLLCGCGKNEAPTPETTEPAPIAAPELDAFGDVLSGRQVFLETLSGEYWDISRLGETITIEEIPCSVHRLTLLDLDQDGTRELVLQLKLGQDEYAGFEVLRYQDGEVSGYPFSYRSFLELKKDGTFRVSGGVFYQGIGALRFRDGGAEIIPVAERIEELAENGTSEILYFIDGNAATEEAYLAMDAQQSAKSDPIWYDSWEAFLASR